MELSSPRAWIVLLACLLAGCAVPPAAGAAAERPNIVFVLADDLSWDLVPHMPQVRKMQRDGMTFRQFVVGDSMCCSSRATILTGEFPHNTRVLTNTWPEGGYRAFRRHGARMRSVGIEHAEPRIRAGDPDVQGWAMGLPSSYSALRTRHLTYVEYENGDRELYDRRRDPGELDNRAGRISAARLARLHAKLERYRRCRGTTSCWSAATSAASRPQAARSAATAPSRSSSAADGHGASPARSASARR